MFVGPVIEIGKDALMDRITQQSHEKNKRSIVGNTSTQKTSHAKGALNFVAWILVQLGSSGSLNREEYHGNQSAIQFRVEMLNEIQRKYAHIKRKLWGLCQQSRPIVTIL